MKEQGQEAGRRSWHGEHGGAGTGSRVKEQGQGAGTGSKDMEQGHGAGSRDRKQGQGAGTGSRNREQGQGAGSRDMEQGQGAGTGSRDRKQGEGAGTGLRRPDRKGTLTICGGRRTGEHDRRRTITVWEGGGGTEET